MTQFVIDVLAKLKVPRPVNIKQQEGAKENFKKKLSQQIIYQLEKHQSSLGIYEQIRYWWHSGKSIRTENDGWAKNYS